MITKNENHKKRMVIDYSQIINKFTQLDAYPLPKIQDLINTIANYRIFSKIDLRSAYHQIPIKESDKQYTAFEGLGSLFQFNRMPFGITNGVACFQRVMNQFIEENNLNATFAYIDDITICGKSVEEHDMNLKKFLDAAKKKNLTFNDNKCVFKTKSVKLLGFLIENGQIQPDPDRIKPLKDLPLPTDSKSLKRTIGMFSHYSSWLPYFSKNKNQTSYSVHYFSSVYRCEEIF